MSIEAVVICKMIGTGTMDDPLRPDLPAGVDFPNGYTGDGAGNTLLVPVETAAAETIAPCLVLWSAPKEEPNAI